VSAEIVRVSEVPNLDPPPMFSLLDTSGPAGLPMIELPSGHTAVHLTRYADVRAALVAPEFSRAAANAEVGASFLPTPLPPELLIATDGASHDRLRSAISGPYAANRIAELAPLLDELITDQLMALRNADDPDLLSVLAEVPALAHAALLGLSPADRAHYGAWTHRVQLAPRTDLPGLISDFTAVYQYVLELVRGERPAAPGGAIADLLADAGPLSVPELVGLVLGALVAGDQNILSVLAKAVYTLLARPVLWRSLVDDPASAAGLVEELFRLIPLGRPSAFPRVAVHEALLPSGVLPAGTVIYPDAFAANRDPAVFPDPLRIDPRRAGRRHLQFGHGPHHCLGAALNRLVVTTLLTRLAAELPGLTLAVAPAELAWDDGVLLRRPVALPVRW
jgi:cytochrome P450